MKTREELQQELSDLEKQHRQILNSSSYRLGRLLISVCRSPRLLFRLPIDLMHLARDVRQQKRPPQPGSSQYETVSRQWRQLAKHLQSNPNSGPLVFLFSGTTYIQGTRGNRPIRQTEALLRLGASVFFSYHRSRYTEALPDYSTEGLVQAPVDITLQLLDDIAFEELGDTKKLYIISYPYPGIEKSIATFRKNGWTVLYDCRDDWEEFSKVGMARWFDADVENTLVRGTDATVCVSQPLVAKMSALSPGSRVELMPNAVEADFLPGDYEHRPERDPKIVGYFGHLAGAWFDWEAFSEIAERCSAYRFEIIGHSAPHGLTLPDNVELLGPKPWNQLYQFAGRWSAAIIPFKMGPLADGVDPIKIYEYLSFGLPVVSFQMPQINDYPATRTVSSVQEFCCALVEVCESAPDKAHIVEFLKRNTWEVRATELLSFVEHQSS
ncbi:methyltransferase [Marinobacter sp. NP-4(2019)]|uniref:glycosyltransferase n=1 Tax=Marinobacter sp. NP-4(2019) TaxID=2488665 RepID=UPI000FC3EE93|nr:glycosyltransferase [Marinobacter sp. NP-4(2019)]AZT84502.1 methyltransferase [Marinobacter sp. NP-4(2019)]